MNPTQLIDDLIEGRVDTRAAEDEKAKVQREQDVLRWLDNSITKERLLELDRVIEETEDVMFVGALKPEVEDRESRVMTIRLATLKFIRMKLTSTTT